MRAHGRVFAITFGTGFHAIAKATIESDFGMKVAANSVDPEKIKLADARGLGKGKRNATARLPVPNETFALGLLTDEEWIRKFGGETRLPGFAKSVSGADSLQLTFEDFSLLDLSPTLGQALDLFRSTSYRAHFPFLDYFRRETDADLINTLDGKIAGRIRAGDSELGFALPDESEVTADIYRLSRRRRQRWLSELRSEDVYQAIEQIDAVQDPMRSVQVQAFDINGTPVTEREPLRSYVVGTLRHTSSGQHRVYALTAGAWFRVDQDYVDFVDRYLRDNVADVTGELPLPVWDDDFLVQRSIAGRYGEERYNRWVSQQAGYALLDRDLYRQNGNVRVEVCDLLTPDKQLICVKRMDGSDKLSHLFQQGSVSTRMTMVNDDYRAKLMASLRSLDPDANFDNPTDWTVVFGIATSKPGRLRDIMYFFSRAALKTHAEAIRSCGFKVAVCKIDKVERSLGPTAHNASA